MCCDCAVNPGFGGQKFIEYQVEKVRKLRQMCDDAGVNPWIELDGGISGKNAYKVSCSSLSCNPTMLVQSTWKVPQLHEWASSQFNTQCPSVKSLSPSVEVSRNTKLSWPLPDSASRLFCQLNSKSAFNFSARLLSAHIFVTAQRHMILVT